MDTKAEQQLLTDYSEIINNLFKSIHKTFTSYICEKTKNLGFTVPQMMLIFQLHNHPFITLQELSNKLGLSKSTVSGMVDRLEHQQVIVREIPKEKPQNCKIIAVSHV